MPTPAFIPTDILLPRRKDLSAWSVIACDQFTADPAYWDRVAENTGREPSSLQLMLPEAWLGEVNEAVEARRIQTVMASFLAGEIFTCLPDCYMYIERTLSDGRLRRGLLGAVDLEAYDYRPGQLGQVRPTEAVVADRLPPRVDIRAQAPLEMPHIMVFLDDPGRTVIRPLGEVCRPMKPRYDFDLMEGGGHITGWSVSGRQARLTRQALLELSLRRGDAPLYAVGDGNHSLAAAKLCWERLRGELSPAQRKVHPARYCLAELVELQDEGVSFSPIHRALLNTDAGAFPEAVSRWLTARSGEDGQAVTWVCGDRRETVTVAGLTLGELIAETDRFAETYLAAHGGRADYIHGETEAEALGARPGCAAILLPALQKEALFPTLEKSGPFPKKSFSVGQARDKRYYLECRRLDTRDYRRAAPKR